MSTYLVAFIVSEFECRENLDRNFCVCSRPNAYNQTEYGLEFGPKIQQKFSDYFDYAYNKHANKLTLTALPDAPFAMENWGTSIIN